MNQDKRYLKTEKLIRTEFYSMLQSQPYESITIEKLCENIMISKNTFYAHYRNKESLLKNLIDSKFSGILDYFMEHHKSVYTNDLNTLESDIRHTFSYVDEHIEDFKLFFRIDNQINFSIQFANILKQYTLSSIRKLTGSENDKLKSIILINFLSTGMVRMLKDYVTHNKEISLDDMINIALLAQMPATKEFTDIAYNFKN